MLLCIMKGIILLEGRSEKMEINAETIYEQTRESLNTTIQLFRYASIKREEIETKERSTRNGALNVRKKSKPEFHGTCIFIGFVV